MSNYSSAEFGVWAQTAISADFLFIYLTSLVSVELRRTMCAALDPIALLFSTGARMAVTLPWGALRFQHSQAIRAALSERCKYTTVNKMLSALRGVVKVAYQLGHMSADEYAKSCGKDCSHRIQESLRTSYLSRL
jgi:hypothetical protein